MENLHLLEFLAEAFRMPCAPFSMLGGPGGPGCDEVLFPVHISTLFGINVFKYQFLCTNGKISIRIKIEIIFIFRLHRRPIQLVMSVPFINTTTMSASTSWGC